MGRVNVSITFPEALLAEIDATARREARSRSELLRVAARLYVERRQRWQDVFRLGDRIRRECGLTEVDVQQEIDAVRRGRGCRGNQR